MEIYIVVFSDNGFCKVFLCKSIYIVFLYFEDRWCYIYLVGRCNCVLGCVKNILVIEIYCNFFVYKYYSMRERVREVIILKYEK